MTLFSRINPDTGSPDVRDFSSTPPASKGWLLLNLVAAPTPSANEVLVESITFGVGSATQTWTLRAKTQNELSAEADATDRAALRADDVLVLLKAEAEDTSSLTAAQFRRLAARVLLFLVRRAIGA